MARPLNIGNIKNIQKSRDRGRIEATIPVLRSEREKRFAEAQKLDAEITRIASNNRSGDNSTRKTNSQRVRSLQKRRDELYRQVAVLRRGERLANDRIRDLGRSRQEITERKNQDARNPRAGSAKARDRAYTQRVRKSVTAQVRAQDQARAQRTVRKTQTNTRLTPQTNVAPGVNIARSEITGRTVLIRDGGRGVNEGALARSEQSRNAFGLAVQPFNRQLYFDTGTAPVPQNRWIERPDIIGWVLRTNRNVGRRLEQGLFPDRGGQTPLDAVAPRFAQSFRSSNAREQVEQGIRDFTVRNPGGFFLTNAAAGRLVGKLGSNVQRSASAGVKGAKTSNRLFKGTATGLGIVGAGAVGLEVANSPEPIRTATKRAGQAAMFSAGYFSATERARIFFTPQLRPGPRTTGRAPQGRGVVDIVGNPNAPRSKTFDFTKDPTPIRTKINEGRPSAWTQTPSNRQVNKVVLIDDEFGPIEITRTAGFLGKRGQATFGPRLARPQQTFKPPTQRGTPSRSNARSLLNRNTNIEIPRFSRASLRTGLFASPIAAARPTSAQGTFSFSRQTPANDAAFRFDTGLRQGTIPLQATASAFAFGSAASSFGSSGFGSGGFKPFGGGTSAVPPTTNKIPRFGFPDRQNNLSGKRSNPFFGAGTPPLYSPSVFAQTFNISAPSLKSVVPASGRFSGFELRPVIRRRKK